MNKDLPVIFSQKYMKRTFLLLVVLAVAIVFFTAGCAHTEKASLNGQSDQTTGLSNPSASQTSLAEQAKIKVVASIYPMYDFALKVGGEQIELVTLVQAGSDPHSWEPTAADIVQLEQADVFIYNGAGMEHWVDSVLAALQNDQLIIVETTAGLDLLAGHSHDHDDESDHVDDHDDVHDHDPAGELDDGVLDPHVWLDPALAKEQMLKIRDALIAADVDGTDYYTQNYDEAAEQFDQLDREYHDRLADLQHRDLVVSHEAFGYMAKAYGLNQIGVAGITPDDEPDPARLAEIIELVNEKEIKVIFFEELVSSKVINTIAEATGVETAVLNTLGGLTKKQTESGLEYITVMRNNLDVLVTAFSE